MKNNNKYAVFSFYNTPSGMFSWWDDFPDMIEEKVQEKDIDFFQYYKSYTENSSKDKKDQKPTHPTNPMWLLEIWKASRKYEKVIFHTHSFYRDFPVYLLTVFRRNHIWIKTEHRLGKGDVKKSKQKIRALLRFFNAGPKLIVGVSNAVAKRNKLLHGDVVRTIHNGVEGVSVNYHREPRKPRNALYVGRLTPEKGIENLVEAFKLLGEDSNYDDVTLTVVGKGPSMKKINAVVEQHGLADKINICGYQTDPIPYYKQADFLVVPTIILEACPLVTLEARRYQLPILYANRGGLVETVGEGAKPLVGTDPQQLCDSIKNFVNEPYEYNSLIEKSANNLEYFSIDRMTDEYVALYEELFECTARN